MQKSDGKLNEDFISQITTNKTEFFREKIQFDFMLAKLRTKILNNEEVFIWSAACSTGQEPYSIAMQLSENFGLHKAHLWKILATDVDDRVLNQSVQGFYTEDEVRDLSVNFKDKYFDEIGPYFHLKDQIVEQVHFSKLNLVNTNYPIQKKFDFIFCRNVFIYFDEQTKNCISMRLRDFLKPAGYLVLGLSEAGSVKIEGLASVSPAIYQKGNK